MLTVTTHCIAIYPFSWTQTHTERQSPNNYITLMHKRTKDQYNVHQVS